MVAARTCGRREIESGRFEIIDVAKMRVAQDGRHWPAIEQKMRASIVKTLTEKKRADMLTVLQIQERAITPADVIVTAPMSWYG